MSLTADSFQRCCRLCAEEQDVTIMLFSEEAESMLLKKKLNKYLLIEVDEDDKLPKNICLKCCSKLQTVCDFIDQAVKAQEILHKQSLTLEQKQSHILQQNQRLTPEQKHSATLEQSVSLEPIQYKTIKQEPYSDSDEDLKFATMEISVDPMMVLQNSEDTDIQSRTAENSESDEEDISYLHRVDEEDVSYLHGVDGQDVTIKLIKRVDKLNTIDGKPFPCCICNRSFHTELALKNHMWVHKTNREEPKPFKCGSCGEFFSRKNELVIHLKRHNYSSGICMICGRRFRTAANLAAHMEAHNSTTGRSYTCKVCGRSYNTSSNLKTHSVTHSNERPYKCTYCKKCFKRNQDLKFHINQHTGEKPYKCPFCDKRFASSGNCYSHKSRMHGRRTDNIRKRIVAREGNPTQFRPIAPKPVQGSITPKSGVVVKAPLKYQCTLCDHSFLKRDNFTYHMYQHTGVKPFQCSFCSETFVTRQGLLNHHDKAHPGKDRPLALISRNALLK